ncbi:zinc finger protein 135-like [Haliotis rubra]|uniref:zinc finger protein 135-like n=1 Tax=Haliotis rubra TaxID=36100 RepID=UPI001EE5CD16|nr:zinc finger protein 135-like [Haliotis rubra]
MVNTGITFMERKNLVLMETTTRPDQLYSDDVFVIEPSESCDFEIDLSDCNTVRTSDMIHTGARTLLASSDAAMDGFDDGFSSEEETIVQIELQSDVTGAAANQTVLKERSLETHNSSLEWPVMTSSDGATVHDDVSISVCGAIHKPEQAPIQNLKSACSRGISCSSEEQDISSDGIMRTAKVIQASSHREEMSSLEEGLSCDGSGSGQRINQAQTQHVYKVLRADPSIRVSSDPLSVFSDHVTPETCYEAPQTAQSCDKCQLNFKSADLLLKHFSKVHRKEENIFGIRKRNTHHLPHASSSLNELHWSERKKGYQTLQNAQSCDKSDLRSSSPEMLQKHSANVEETGIFKHTRKLNCTICGEVSMSSQALHKHLLMHAGITAFDCDGCGKVFTSVSDLRQHLCIHQKTLKNQEYKCNECGMTFAEYARLMYHKKIKHQDKYWHGCKVCGKTFPAAVRLKYHMLVHSQKRDFHCSICEKSFKCKRYLDNHSYSHSPDRPFACSVCDKRFKRKQSRDVHEMKHL